MPATPHPRSPFMKQRQGQQEGEAVGYGGGAQASRQSLDVPEMPPDNTGGRCGRCEEVPWGWERNELHMDARK